MRIFVVDIPASPFMVFIQKTSEIVGSPFLLDMLMAGRLVVERFVKWNLLLES
jgi:hypothetical protein